MKSTANRKPGTRSGRRHGRRLVVIFLMLIILSCVGILVFLKPFGKSKFSELIDSLPTYDSMPPVDVQQFMRDSIIALRIDSLLNDTLLPDTSKCSITLYSLTSDRIIYQHNSREWLIPASCMKIPTAIAAFHILGEDFTYHSSVKIRGEQHGDTLEGDVLLQLDDDPTLFSLDTLTQQIYDAGIHVVKGHLLTEVERHDTLKSHPTTPLNDIKLEKIPATLRGTLHPAIEFPLALKRTGIKVDSLHTTDCTQKPWRELVVHDTPLPTVLTDMLLYSVNVEAEALLYRMDKKKQLFDGNVMQWDHIHAPQLFWQQRFPSIDNLLMTWDASIQGAVFNDASGLSNGNRLSTHLLMQMLLYAWHDPHLHDFLINEALPTPSHPTRTGTLIYRMTDSLYHDRVFAKTGTLMSTGVTSLSGYLHASDDAWYVFSIINQNCPNPEGRYFQDLVCREVIRP